MDRVSLGGLVAKIVGFGDSFVFGNELADNDDGRKAWPALAARALGCDYDTRAVPGCGNDNIAQQIYSYFSSHNAKDVIAVINWTWSMRWDFHLARRDHWITLGPTCVPGKLQSLLKTREATRLIGFYRDYAGSSDKWNRFRSLQTIFAAQQYLRAKHITNVQTFMDRSLFDRALGSRIDHYKNYRDPSWPDITDENALNTLPSEILDEVEVDYQKNCMPDFVLALQDLVRPALTDFQGMTFLEWSDHHGYPVTELLHPLEQAHQAAAKLWQPIYRDLLDQ